MRASRERLRLSCSQNAGARKKFEREIPCTLPRLIQCFVIIY
uniref:Uncharacterized protein n=1 Tax=Rhizophora mucronata TaxID=61149 RepID=A0A2P2P128_RHIMU